MINTNEANKDCISRRLPRTAYDVVCEISYERREIAGNLARLNETIKADPKDVSAYHKELWRRQAKALQEYVDILGERIKDLIDNG